MFKKFFQAGGVIAGALLVAFGIGAIVIGFTGRSEVRSVSGARHTCTIGVAPMIPAPIARSNSGVRYQAGV